MRQVNDHVKHIMGIKPKRKINIDFMKIFIWSLIGAIAVAVWTTIYNLIF